MKNQHLINALKKNYESLIALDKKSFLKENLGDESLKSEIDYDIEQYTRRVSDIIKYGSKLSTDLLNRTISSVSNLRSYLDSIIKQPSQDFISKKNEHIQSIRSCFNTIDNDWPSVIAIMVEQMGLLSNKEEHERLKKEQFKNAEEVIEKIKLESQNILDKAKNEAHAIIKKAEEISKLKEERATRTAKKISVKEAQDQFDQAQKEHYKSVILWSILSFITLALFIIIAILFYKDVTTLNRHLIIYITALRMTILLSIGAVATYCLKILRSSYHMYKHNQHRKRLANCISSFVESGETPEQRDKILSILIEAICYFQSGLVKTEDDNINATKFVVDNLVRNISQKN